jgi:hypothetical protein
MPPGIMPGAPGVNAVIDIDRFGFGGGAPPGNAGAPPTGGGPPMRGGTDGNPRALIDGLKSS